MLLLAYLVQGVRIRQDGIRIQRNVPSPKQIFTNIVNTIVPKSYFPWQKSEGVTGSLSCPRQKAARVQVEQEFQPRLPDPVLMPNCYSNCLLSNNGDEKALECKEICTCVGYCIDEPLISA